MRKVSSASQDGGDSTSITSGIESETKKPGAGILKSTRNSIKRKVQHFSDDTANEPLLHKNKELSEIEKQSAKLLLTKTKTDFGCQKGDDKDKLLADEKIEKPSISDVTGITHHGVLTGIGNGVKEQKYSNVQPISTGSIHNHMNTNVFGNMEGLKNSVVAKTQILVELDTTKSTGYNPSPLIFTTAKIHTDGKMQQMEPVQVTPVPILSTIEGGVVKTETKTKESSEKPESGKLIEIKNKNVTEQQSKENKNTTITSPQVAILSKVSEQHKFNTTSTQNTIGSTCNKPAQSASNLISDKKDTDASTVKNIVSNETNIKNTPSQLPDILKKSKNEIFSTKIPQLPQKIDDSTGSKLSCSTVKSTESTISSIKLSILNKTDMAHNISCSSSTPEKNYVDINKNIQADSQREPEGKQSGNNKVDLKAVASKPINDTHTIKEIGIGPSIKQEISKINSRPLSTSKTIKENTQDKKTTDTKPQEEAQYNVKSLSSEKSAIITPAMANNANKTTERAVTKASSPSTLCSTSKINTAIDKTSSALSSKTISEETSPLIKPLFKKSGTSEKSDVIRTVPCSTSTLTDTTSKIPKTASSSSSKLSEIKYSTESSKVLPGPISNVFGLENNQNATSNAACKSKTTGNSIIKTSTAASPNNVATVVSSISKPITTASGIKLPSSSTPTTGAVKPVPKQSLSAKTIPSGIPTVSSSVKSSTAANKTKNNIPKPTNSTAKVSTSDNSSITGSALSSTAKLSSTCSTKTAAKTVSQSQDKPSGAVKDAKDSKA